jgi:hypothetical protein
VERNRQALTVVRDVMNVARRDERDDRARGTHGAPGDYQVWIGVGAGDFINGLVFFSPVHADDTPGDVIVNRRRLTRQPDERDDGEAAIRFDMQNVLAIFYLVGLELLGAEKVLASEIRLKEIGHGGTNSFSLGFGFHDSADG